MFTSNAISGEPLSNYREVLCWKISEESSRLVMMNLLSIPLAVVFGIAFFLFVLMFGGLPQFALSDNGILIFLIGVVIVLALHEFVHSVLMQSFGAKPRYGFFAKGLMFYAKAPGHAFKRNQYILILLGPLVGLSILACFGIIMLPSTQFVWIFAIWAIVNSSATNADLWITAIVLRYPASAYVVDERDGIRILLPQGDTIGE